MAPMLPIRQRDKDSILQALSTGVVPRAGLAHIQVGRANEVSALVSDVTRICEGGSAVRFVIGEYGAGKTFFLSLIRSIALEMKCVTIQADLAAERRLHASDGQARSLYQEAIRNISTRANPDGGALPGIVEKFIGDCVKKAAADGASVEVEIEKRFASLLEYVGGHDYVAVLKAYWRGHETGEQGLKDKALRWIRGEYTRKTDAKADLGVATIIDDHNVYDRIKLLAAFVKLAGFSGLVVLFDEMVNLYKLQSAQAREKNYEEILRIVNDMLQGNMGGLGFVFGGTPEFLVDTRRGLYSYQALQSRLVENVFAVNGLVDYRGPVLRLQNLSVEDLLLLLEKIRNIYALGDPGKYLVPDSALLAFMEHCHKRIGEAYFRTPRTTIKTFVQLLSVLEQNPGADWQQLLGASKIEVDKDVVDQGETDGGGVDDDLSSIRL